jgi:hypothetical protein
MKMWKHTRLWETIKAKNSVEADDVRAYLLNPSCMDSIEAILKWGNPDITKDFTLHDAEHSFRVAERMWEIIPDETKAILSSYELMLLLLSAYLHDIGMSPRLGIVQDLFTLVTTGKQEGNLNASEVFELQDWFDRGGKSVDLKNGDVIDTEEARRTLMMYCRHRHNDWSEYWIRNELGKQKVSDYTNFLNDLVEICKSHHCGIEALKTQKFDPVRVNIHVVHRRYLSMCLRLADVLEIDTERAPDVLFSHRDIIGPSVSHWLKEKFTSIAIDRGYVFVTARPERSFVHKAILDTINLIEAETKLCKQLVDEKPLNLFPPLNVLAHKWNIAPAPQVDVESNGDYEFIDGTFRPNVTKLLELLAGTALYKKPLHAIRELLQNSFDAVKTQIAYKFLRGHFSIEQQIETQNRYKVILEYYEKDGHRWLRCIDEGVGMSKENILKSFLVGGTSENYERTALVRECRQNGYDLSITGKFGIGVLSYFMIAERIEFTTKKSIDTGTVLPAWHFSIDGLMDFGELKRDNKENHGTELLLRLRSDFDFNEYVLEDYLRKTVRYTPCHFTVVYNGKKILDATAGWNPLFDYKKLLSESLYIHCSKHYQGSDAHGMLKSISIDDFHTWKNNREAELSGAANVAIIEGRLKSATGIFRVHIPYFELPAGKSFVYLSDNEPHPKYGHILNGLTFFHAQLRDFENTFSFSWKGMQTHAHIDQRPLIRNSFIEVDVIEIAHGNISVSRDQLITSKEIFSDLIKEINSQIDELVSIHLAEFFDSPYGIINSRVNNIGTPSNSARKWVSMSNGFFSVVNLSPPLTFNFRSDKVKSETLLHNKKAAVVNTSIDKYGSGFYLGNAIEYDRVLIRKDGSIITPIVENDIRINNLTQVLNSAYFPPEYNDVYISCSNSYPELNILNRNHNLFKYFDSKEYILLQDDLSPDVTNKELITIDTKKITSKSECTYLLAHIFMSSVRSKMDKIDPDLLQRVFNIIGDELPNNLVYIFLGDECVEVKRAGMEFRDRETVIDSLGEVGPEWII